jgi:hypothetical protein
VRRAPEERAQDELRPALKSQKEDTLRIRPHVQTVVVAVITTVVVAAAPAVAHVTESWTHLRTKHVRPFSDKRYYKKTTLRSPGAINTSTNPVDWTKLKGVPVDFADGVDDTSGTASDLVCSGCVETSDLAPDAVTSAKILDGEVAVVDLGFDPATQGELDALATPGTINQASNPMHWTKLHGVPGGLADGTDEGVTTGTDGVAVSGTTAQLADCTSTGQIFKYNAVTNTWSCSSDNDTTYTGSDGIAVAGTDIRLDDCGANEVWKRNSADSAWVCADDVTAAIEASAAVSGTVDTTAATEGSITVSFPRDGFALISAEATFEPTSLAAPDQINASIMEGATTVQSWHWDSGDDDNNIDAHESFSEVAAVTSGSHTYDLQLQTVGALSTASYENLRIVVMFFPTGL